MAEQFRRADVSGVKEVSNMFEGKEFCVVNAPKELSKQEMERKIVEVNQNCFSLFLSVHENALNFSTAWWYICAKSWTRHFLCSGE